MITIKQRAFLRAKSNDLPDLVFIGKEGVNANIVKQVADNLLAHELIKIKVQRGSDFTSKQLANELALVTESEVISVVGSKIILYKFTTNKGFKHFLPNNLA